MKYILTVLLIMILRNTSDAQLPVPYKAILETQAGKLKGVLQRIDSSSIVLAVEGRFTKVNIVDIQYIKIRRLKNAYRYKNYMKEGSIEQSKYQLNSNGDLVDRFGNKAPTLAQEIAAPFWLAAVNGVFNTIAFPIHAINPNIAKFKLNGRADSTQKAQLTYYSISYQLKPNLHAELRKLKEISKEAKPIMK